MRLTNYIAELRLKERCPEFSFFIQEGSCDGENEKLYSIRLRKGGLPSELLPYFEAYQDLQSEAELVAKYKSREIESFVPSNLGGDPVIYISNELDVYFNFTHMRSEWKIGKIGDDSISELSRRIKEEDIPALKKAASITLAELAAQYGDENSKRLFTQEDYKMYLLNRHLAIGE